MFRFLVLALLSLPGSVLADDPIKATLEKAREQYTARTNQLAEGLAKQVELRVKQLAKNGDQAAAQALLDQFQAYQKDGTPPTAPLLKLDLKHYDEDVQTAKYEWKKALDQAITAYTKAGLLREAAALAPQSQAFVFPNVGKLVAEKPAPKDPFPVGSVWKGMVVREWFPSGEGKTFTVEFTVTERDGSKFKAKFVVDNGQHHLEVQGLLTKDGVLSWKGINTTALQNGGGFMRFDHDGTLKGDVMRLRASGINAQNVRVKATYHLEIQR